MKAVAGHHQPPAGIERRFTDVHGRVVDEILARERTVTPHSRRVPGVTE